jgi:four helix bundle protein
MLFPPRSPADTPGTDSTFAPLLDAERLDVYQLALDFQRVANSLPLRTQGTLRNQLERASVSIVLNIAEGAGRRSPQDKCRFYSIARGSATECAAILDLIRRRGLASEACQTGRHLIIRIVQMLTKLEASTLARTRPREVHSQSPKKGPA